MIYLICILCFIILLSLKAIHLTKKQILLLHEEGNWLKEHLPNLVSSGYIQLDSSKEKWELKLFLRKRDLDRQYWFCILFPWESFETKPLAEYYGLKGK